jgi:hypothetical protein
VEDKYLSSSFAKELETPCVPHMVMITTTTKMMLTILTESFVLQTGIEARRYNSSSSSRFDDSVASTVAVALSLRDSSCN